MEKCAPHSYPRRIFYLWDVKKVFIVDLGQPQMNRRSNIDSWHTFKSSNWKSRTKNVPHQTKLTEYWSSNIKDQSSISILISQAKSVKISLLIPLPGMSRQEGVFEGLCANKHIPWGIERRSSHLTVTTKKWESSFKVQVSAQVTAKTDIRRQKLCKPDERGIRNVSTT